MFAMPGQRGKFRDRCSPNTPDGDAIASLGASSSTRKLFVYVLGAQWGQFELKLIRQSGIAAIICWEYFAAPREPPGAFRRDLSTILTF